MRSRSDLSAALKNALGSDQVYYQSPNNTRMRYPSIVYNRDNIEGNFANNKRYLRSDVYTITLITKDPDSVVIDNILEISNCRYVRHYKADGLYHNIFEIKY